MIDRRSSFSLFDSSGNFSLGTRHWLVSYTGLVLAIFWLAYFDLQLGIYFSSCSFGPLFWHFMLRGASDEKAFSQFGIKCLLFSKPFWIPFVEFHGLALRNLIPFCVKLLAKDLLFVDEKAYLSSMDSIYSFSSFLNLFRVHRLMPCLYLCCASLVFLTIFLNFRLNLLSRDMLFTDKRCDTLCA